MSDMPDEMRLHGPGERENADAADAADAVDALIARVIDSEASPRDWDELERRAVRDPSVWSCLAQAHRDDAGLRAGLADALAPADTVHAPLPTTGAPRRLAAALHHAGWAAAALLALAWIIVDVVSLPASSRAPAVANAADALFEQYRDAGQREGRILRELPKQMMQAAPLPEGGWEVIYIRSLLEREIVQSMFTDGVDEHGRVRPVPITNASLRPEKDM